jgi:peptide-methionine (S)-S-oxide reductase
VPQALPFVRPALIFAALLLIGAGVAFRGFSVRAEGARVIPPPALDEPASANSEAAVVAGGCFWGVQGVFQHVSGVTGAVSGYAGGSAQTAQYETVSSGTTRHAESVEITFEPRRISYGRILQIFFSVAHDPTELNRQGPDVGSQYRSAVFPANAEQARVALAYIAQLNQAHAFPAAIVTTVETGRKFFPAEAYHQNYLALHPTQPYIALNDLPKIAALQRLFPTLYRASPVLVAAAGPVD